MQNKWECKQLESCYEIERWILLLSTIAYDSFSILAENFHEIPMTCEKQRLSDVIQL